jgi:hypothetical protein
MKNWGRMINGWWKVNGKEASVKTGKLGSAVLVALLVFLGSASQSKAEISVNIGRAG